MNNLSFSIQNDIIEYLNIKNILNLSTTNKDYCNLCQPNIKTYLIEILKEFKKENEYLRNDVETKMKVHLSLPGHCTKILTNNITIYSLDLPRQILNNISEYLNNDTILNLSLVSRDYHNMCYSNIKIYLIKSYKNIKKENYNLIKQYIGTFTNDYSSLRPNQLTEIYH